MSDYTQNTWVDDDGSLTTGTAFEAALMNHLEAGVEDASEHHKVGLLDDRPAASAANKNWLYFATDDDGGTLSYSDGSTWQQWGLGLNDGETTQAGDGLTKTGSTLDVGEGTGIDVTADAVAVDTSVIATRAYAEAYADGGDATVDARIDGLTAGAGLTRTADTFDVVAGTGVTVNANDVAVDTSVIATRAYADAGDATVNARVTGLAAGAGLTRSSDTFNVGAGTGITVNADDVAVDTSVIATKAYVDAISYLTAGAGLTKSGATLNIGAGSGITVNADDVQIATGGVTDAMLAGSISNSKLATNPLARANHTGTQTASTISDFDTQVRTSRLDQMAAPTADVSINSHKLTNVTDPTSAQDAATKAYVDGLIQGLDVKNSVRVASTANVTVANPGTSTFDGITLSSGDRILLKDQSTASQNGIYVFNGSGSAMTRATDADVSADVTSGLFVWVEEGTANADQGYVLTTNQAITLGTTSLTFTQFSGAGQITAGAGLTKTGNTLDVGAGSGITVNADDVAISTGGVTNAMLAGSIALTKLSSGTSAQMIVGDSSGVPTYRTISGDLTIGNTGVTAIGALKVTDAMLAGSISNSKLATNPLARANHTGTQLASTISDFDTQVRTSRLDQMAAPTADLSINSHKLTNVTDPTADQDAATKAYTDKTDWKASVRAVTTAALAANSRAGNVLTASANGALASQDGISLVVGDRLLVTSEGTTANNGIYTVTDLGSGATKWVLTRATDADSSAKITPGLWCFVEEGTLNAAAFYTLKTTGAIVLNTTGLSFTADVFIGSVGGGSIWMMYSSPQILFRKVGNLATNIISTRKSGDTFDALLISANGKIEVGDGTAAVDTNLYRSAANQWTTDDQFEIAIGGGKDTLSLSNAGGGNTGITIGGDTELYRSSSDTLTLDDTFVIGVGGGNKTELQITSTTANTGLTIGGDTNLYRSAADKLKTDDTLHVGADFRHLGTNLGFYNVTAVARPSAYTQTYSTTTRTHSSNLGSDMSTTASVNATNAWGFNTQAQADAIATKFNNLRTDVNNVRDVLNQVIDDLQAVGILQ